MPPPQHGLASLSWIHLEQFKSAHLHVKVDFDVTFFFLLLLLPQNSAT